MAYKVSIIGSFQKYYEDVVKLIQLFRQNDLWVASPKESRINGRVDDFVLFESDNPLYTPEEIQMITLDRILSSDAVYVFNPNGYVGRTTCYEIGFCLCKAIPLYFFQKPSDLPMPIHESQIVSPQMFAELVSNNTYKYVKEYGLCDPARKAFNNIMGLTNDDNKIPEYNIVICGSMMFYDKMVSCQEELRKHDINSVIPKEETDMVSFYSEEKFREFKRRVSNAYLRKIRDKNTIAVLICNEAKNGVDNYIGANTLVELAMAFTWNRKIFIYNDIYSPLADELLAWGSICLNGNLSQLITFVKETIALKCNEESDSFQLSLF